MTEIGEQAIRTLQFHSVTPSGDTLPKLNVAERLSSLAALVSSGGAPLAVQVRVQLQLSSEAAGLS